MAFMERLTTVYATDEDIAVRAGGDFVVLCPGWQKLAQASDGVFFAGSPWILRSSSIDLGVAGVTAGHLVLLSKPNSVFKGSGDLLAVDEAKGGAITLRRIGTAAVQGQPPAPIEGLDGVDFLVTTLAPQIEEASFDLNRRFSVDPGVPGRTPGDLYDLRDLRQACVLTVLVRQYAAESRGAEGDFAPKLARAKQDLSEVLARLQIRWGASGSDNATTNWFSTRIVR